MILKFLGILILKLKFIIQSIILVFIAVRNFEAS